MFLITKPSAEKIRRFIASQQELPFSYPETGATRGPLPTGYVIDHNRIKLGTGRETYERAAAALRKWKHFDLGWGKIVPPETPIQVGATVAMQAQHYGFWSLNACRIVYVISDGTAATDAGVAEPGLTPGARRFGFAYGTLPDHAEQGEERFIIEWNTSDDSVWYDLFAFSNPHSLAAKLGYPVTRNLQKRFQRESLAAMVEAALVSQ
jgi:uncharacterized protein (UPF0548 family)